MNEDNHHDTKFWIGFFIGGLAGAIILFFLGTKEGKKTGKLLEERGRDFLDELQDRLDELEHKGRELARQGEELKSEVLTKLEEKKDEFSDTATEKLDSVLAQIEEIQERSRQATASLRKRLFKNLPKRTA